MTKYHILQTDTGIACLQKIKNFDGISVYLSLPVSKSILEETDLFAAWSEVIADRVVESEGKVIIVCPTRGALVISDKNGDTLVMY